MSDRTRHDIAPHLQEWSRMDRTIEELRQEIDDNAQIIGLIAGERDELRHANADLVAENAALRLRVAALLDEAQANWREPMALTPQGTLVWSEERKTWDCDGAIPESERLSVQELSWRLERDVCSALTPGYYGNQYATAPSRTYPACTVCGATRSNSYAGYGNGYRDDEGRCARCHEQQEVA